MKWRGNVTSLWLGQKTCWWTRQNEWVADIDVYTAASVELMKLMKLIAAATIEWINKINEFNATKGIIITVIWDY